MDVVRESHSATDVGNISDCPDPLSGSPRFGARGIGEESAAIHREEHFSVHRRVGIVEVVWLLARSISHAQHWPRVVVSRAVARAT